MNSTPESFPALKNGFSQATVAGIADLLKRAAPGFDIAAFTERCLQGFDELSLMSRVHRVAVALGESLPPRFPAALATLEKALGEPPDGPREGEGIASFRWAPFPEFVAVAGLDEPELALPALARITRHFSAEFAIRPFLERHLEMTLGHVARWVQDPDARVRRLASEGTRPLLPWGKHVAALKRDPGRCLGLIGPLAQDPSEVVRRSAANHLNDVSRLDPDVALAHAGRWQAEGGDLAVRTVRHALRGLVKQGHPRALGLLGYHVGADIALTSLRLSKVSLKIGESLAIDIQLRSNAKEPVLACIDYAIRYADARGTAERYKVFKGVRQPLLPGEAERLVFTRDFQPRTTRRLYPGQHEVEVLVNGVVLAKLPFKLRK